MADLYRTRSLSLTPHKYKCQTNVLDDVPNFVFLMLTVTFALKLKDLLAPQPIQSTNLSGTYNFLAWHDRLDD